MTRLYIYRDPEEKKNRERYTSWRPISLNLSCNAKIYDIQVEEWKPRAIGPVMSKSMNAISTNSY